MGTGAEKSRTGILLQRCPAAPAAAGTRRTEGFLLKYSATRSDSVVPAVLRPGTYVTTGWQAPSIHPGPCSRALHWWPDMRWEEALTAIRWMSLRG